MRKITRVTHGRILPRAPTLLIASTPKSGSTFMAACLREATGYPGQFLGEHFMSEQDLSEGRILDSLSVPTVVHQHCAATKATIDVVRRYGLTVMFQYRRLDDTLASVLDKLDKDPWLETTYHTNGAFHALDESERVDIVLALVAPRFIRLYASWWTAFTSEQVRGRMMGYDEILRDKPGALSEAMATFGLTLTSAEAEAAIASVETTGNTRFNKGTSGRGADILQPRHDAFLSTLMSPYPWVDFLPVGLRGPLRSDAVLTSPLKDVRI